MDAITGFYLGAFCGLIFGFGLACIRPTASEKEVAQAYEVGHMKALSLPSRKLAANLRQSWRLLGGSHEHRAP